MKPMRPKPRLEPGKQECTVVGCPKPRGERGVGFGTQGLALHMTKMHTKLPGKKVDELTPEEVRALANPPAGLPVIVAGQHSSVQIGHEVIMGEATRLIDDIKQELHVPSFRDLPTYNAPVVSLPEEGDPSGIRIKARNGKLYVMLDTTWEEMDLERFFGNIRWAVAIS